MQKTTINIQGMTCSGCVNSVKTVLEKLPGVVQVEVSLDAAQATILHDPGHCNADQLKQAINDAGFEA